METGARPRWIDVLQGHFASRFHKRPMQKASRAGGRENEIKTTTAPASPATH